MVEVGKFGGLLYRFVTDLQEKHPDILVTVDALLTTYDRKSKRRVHQKPFQVGDHVEVEVSQAGTLIDVKKLRRRIAPEPERRKVISKKRMIALLVILVLGFIFAIIRGLIL
jgi:hypothetical protein